MRLTIAIPTLNRDYCIARALDSALAQTSRDVDIVVSNNGSEDRTGEILRAYADPRLRVFHHDRTMPAWAHANFLLEQARGELFVGLSDDDYLEPEFAERVLGFFGAHPEVSFVYTRCWTHVREMASPSPGGPETEGTMDFFIHYFAGSRHIFWCACVTRTESLRRSGGLRPGVQIGDMHFWTQLAFDGPVGCVAEPLSHYTYLVDNVSVGIPAHEWARETRDMIDRVAERARTLPASPGTHDLLRRLMDEYLARSTANQFVLNAARGARKTDLFAALTKCGAFLKADLSTATPRVAVALLLPRAVIRPLTMAFATRWSRWVSAPRPAVADVSP